MATALRDSRGRFRGSTKGWRAGIPRGQKGKRQIRGAQALVRIGPTVRSPRNTRIPAGVLVGGIVAGAAVGAFASSRRRAKKRAAQRRRSYEQAQRSRS